MKNVLSMTVLGIATLGLTSCGSDRAANKPVQSPVPSVQASAPAFEKPTVSSSSASLPTIPVKGMIQTTNSQARLSQISTSGRRDPFSAVLPASIQLPAQKVAQAPAKQAVQQTPIQQAAPQTIARAPLPLTPIAALPPLPINQTPTIAPPISQTSLAESVQITGVVQVGGKAMAIIQSPEEGTARYVKPGDSVANGRVMLKRIIMSKNGEPTIVLEQNGVEITKSVGSSASIASAR